MILLDLFSISLAAFALYQVNELRKQANTRLTRLETRQPVKLESTTTMHRSQAHEKPILKNAKEVKPLEIGDGRMRFDAEAQIAEWI